MGLRARLERWQWGSGLVVELLGRVSAGYLRLCRATTRWDRHGIDELAALLADGPVIVVLWHEAALMAPMHWPADSAPLTSLRDTSPAGRVSGALQARLGLQPMAMAAKASNRAASRLILRRLAEGISVGLTCDGPRGPVRVVKFAALDWARVSARPVILFAAASRGHIRLANWDRMILPLPFTRGRAIWRQWHAELPRRADAAQVEALRLELAEALDAITRDAWDGLR